jgi:hypothetical protein
LPAIVKRHPDFLGFTDNMFVCDDVTVRANDEPRARATLFETVFHARDRWMIPP